jgi:hypothetical protein
MADGGQLTAAKLIEELKKVDGELEVFFRNVPPITGTISEACRIDVSTYSFFGKSLHCIIIETYAGDDDEKR